MGKQKDIEEFEEEVLNHLRDVENVPDAYIDDDLPRSDMGLTDISAGQIELGEF